MTQFYVNSWFYFRYQACLSYSPNHSLDHCLWIWSSFSSTKITSWSKNIDYMLRETRCIYRLTLKKDNNYGWLQELHSSYGKYEHRTMTYQW